MSAQSFSNKLRKFAPGEENSPNDSLTWDFITIHPNYVPTNGDPDPAYIITTLNSLTTKAEVEPFRAQVAQDTAGMITIGDRPSGGRTH